MKPLLEIDNLHIHFRTQNRTVKAVNGISLMMNNGEIMGLVGESGSGKSVTGISILGLLPKHVGKIVAGSIFFESNDLSKWSDKQFRKIRGRDIAMIFQNPLTALDPYFTVKNQMVETICYRQKLNKSGALQEAKNLLNLVGIQDIKRVLNSYPFALSGGMRQRVIIGMALSCKPKLLIADEPTTALDASIQKQILALLYRINKELNTSILIITHDFGVVSSLCEKVSVMYAGCIVEHGSKEQILTNPRHHYTRGLISAMPDRQNWIRVNGERRLFQIDGSPPDPADLPEGCSFVKRCKEAEEMCRSIKPEMRAVDDAHLVSCHKPGVDISYGASTDGINQGV